MAVHPPPSRTTSARLTLISLLLIPLLSLAALWGFTASITLGNVIRDQHYDTIVNAIAPSITALGQTLQAERAVTLVWLGTDRQSAQARAELLAARSGTDKYAPAARSAVTSVRGLLTAPEKTWLDTFVADLASLSRIRAAVDSGADSPVAAFNAYNAISTAEYAYFHNSTPPGDPELSLMTQASIAEARAQDSSEGAIALIEGTLAARGLMTPPQRALFAEVVGQQNLELGDTFSMANPALTALFGRIFDSPAYHQLVATENQVEASPANRPIPVNPATFQATVQAIQAGTQANGAQVGVVLAAQASNLKDSLVTELVLAGGLGLVAVLASVFVAVRFGRRLRVELTNLFDSARQMANERLPRLVERLRRGEDVDVQAESPPLKAGRITEIANVAQAFSTVQRTAVEAAVGQARLRKGVNQVFVNLSLRNQSLLHRQLAMLDGMERATSDPAALADLFRLDHLTTRMRRHAEGLLILSGATPGRGWRDPVPVVDVLHAAIAEIEDYVRVDVISESSDAVAGTAVNDVIHLIAELIENATAFSPPNTRVDIRGDAVAHGFALEIEDRGLGLPAEEIASINERLASPPEFDLANSDQLGLFVAGQLAARHGIRVSLRPSPFGGTTAIVLLPREIIVPEHETGAWFGPGGAGELPSTAANGSAREAGPGGNRDRGSAFGLTGRHHLGSSPSSPEDGWAEPPLAVTAARPLALPSPAPPVQDRPAWGQPGPAQAPTGSLPAGADPSGPGQATNSTAGRGTYLGLPRRVRQASLAPQLSGQLGSEPAAPPREAAEPWARSPEETSSVMSALQDGWQRGRRDELDYPDGGLDYPDGGLDLGEWPGGTSAGWPGGAAGSAAESDNREVQS